MKRRTFIKYGITTATAATVLHGVEVPEAQAGPLAIGLSDPALQPLFTEPVTNALSDAFKFVGKLEDDDDNCGALTKTEYKIEIRQIVQETGLVDAAGVRLATTVWGYGAKNVPASWPGRTVEVQAFEHVEIKWKNKLQDAAGPLPHLLPVDESIHWCYGLPGYETVTVATDGVPVVTHVHGAHVNAASDGNPEYFFGLTTASRGPRWTQKKYTYHNSQAAGALWYHDHALGITRLNVYAGLAGFYIIRDSLDTGLHDNPLGLPAKEYEHGYVVQDRMFTDTGALFFPALPGDPTYADFITAMGATPPPGQPTVLAEFFGDHIVVNGKIWPKVDVEPRNYRLRLLNGCDSRFMRLRFREVPMNDTDFTNASDPLPFYVIGSDQGLLATPVEVTEVDFMPAERLDIVFDFGSVSPCSRIIVENILGDIPFNGTLPNLDPNQGEVFFDRRTDRVMAFDVVAPLSAIADNFVAGSVVSNYTRNNNPVDKVRKLALFEGTDEFGRLQPMLGTAEPVMDVTGAVVNGTLPWHMPITENPALGATEIWEIHNVTEDAHPIHVHLIHFDILDRIPIDQNATVVVPQDVVQHNGAIGVGRRIETLVVDSANPSPPLATELGPKDMVIALPWTVTRIKMTFDKPGRYVWHCHILSHEDHDMMRPFHIGPVA